MRLILPEGSAGFDAAVFKQDGTFVMVGHREECEQRAEETGALYCWIHRVAGSVRVIVRKDYEWVHFDSTEWRNEIN